VLVLKCLVDQFVRVCVGYDDGRERYIRVCLIEGGLIVVSTRAREIDSSTRGGRIVEERQVRVGERGIREVDGATSSGDVLDERAIDQGRRRLVGTQRTAVARRDAVRHKGRVGDEERRLLDERDGGRSIADQCAVEESELRVGVEHDAALAVGGAVGRARRTAVVAEGGVGGHDALRSNPQTDGVVGDVAQHERRVRRRRDHSARVGDRETRQHDARGAERERHRRVATTRQDSRRRTLGRSHSHGLSDGREVGRAAVGAREQEDRVVRLGGRQRRRQRVERVVQRTAACRCSEHRHVQVGAVCWWHHKYHQQQQRRRRHHCHCHGVQQCGS